MDLNSYVDLEHRKIVWIFSYELQNGKHGEIKCLPKTQEYINKLLPIYTNSLIFSFSIPMLLFQTVIGKYW